MDKETIQLIVSIKSIQEDQEYIRELRKSELIKDINQCKEIFKENPILETQEICKECIKNLKMKYIEDKFNKEIIESIESIELNSCKLKKDDQDIIKHLTIEFILKISKIICNIMKDMKLIDLHKQIQNKWFIKDRIETFIGNLMIYYSIKCINKEDWKNGHIVNNNYTNTNNNESILKPYWKDNNNSNKHKYKFNISHQNGNIISILTNNSKIIDLGIDITNKNDFIKSNLNYQDIINIYGLQFNDLEFQLINEICHKLKNQNPDTDINEIFIKIFLELWSLKESFVKLLGCGITTSKIDLRNLIFYNKNDENDEKRIISNIEKEYLNNYYSFNTISSINLNILNNKNNINIGYRNQLNSNWIYQFDEFRSFNYNLNKNNRNIKLDLFYPINNNYPISIAIEYINEPDLNLKGFEIIEFKDLINYIYK